MNNSLPVDTIICICTMFVLGRRRACVSVASITLVFQFRATRAFSISQSVVHSFGLQEGGKLLRRKLQYTTTRFASSTAAAAGEAIPPSPFAQLYDQTLVTVQQCIDACNQQQHQQQQQTSSQHQQANTASPSPKIVFIDGSWYHKPNPVTGLTRNPSQEYIKGPRLPDARYLDIDAIATTKEMFPDENPKDLPHMFPPPKLFGLTMDAYNIQNDDHVIVYARRGALFTPRVWFLFISMGHDPNKVHVMQGSLEDYIEEGGLIETTTDSLLVSCPEETVQQQKDVTTWVGESYVDFFDQGILDVARLYQKHYATTTPQYSLSVSSAMHICGKEEVLDAVNQHLEGVDDDATTMQKKPVVILDTRGSGYTKNGYMPSAIHLPYSQIATPDNALTIKSKESLKKLFEDRGIDYLDPEQKIILSCGSGV